MRRIPASSAELAPHVLASGGCFASCCRLFAIVYREARWAATPYVAWAWEAALPGLNAAGFPAAQKIYNPNIQTAH